MEIIASADLAIAVIVDIDDHAVDEHDVTGGDDGSGASEARYRLGYAALPERKNAAGGEAVPAAA